MFFRHNDGRFLRYPAERPGEFSNRSGVGVPYVTVVLFDLLNERFDTRGIAANEMVHDLGEVEAADNLYLYLLTVDGRIFAVHGFAGPEIEANQTAGTPWTRGIKPLLDHAMRTVLRTRLVDIDVAVRVQLTFSALNAIAEELSVFAGRKNVVWVTDGVPAALGPRRSDTGDFVDFTPQLRQLSEVFDRSQTAIYPVQQIMLGSPDAMDGSGLGSRETLDELAGLTGGRPNTGKDIAAALQQALTDARTSYHIGFSSSVRNRDGRFHRLRITSTRKGVRIQARTGYYSSPESPGARTERAIAAALSLRSDAAEIGLRATVTPNPVNPQHVHLALRIDANDIALPLDAGQYGGQLRIALVGYRPDGSITNSTTVPIDLHYSGEERDRSLREGIAFSPEVVLEKDMDKLRVVVFDRGSNAIGSLTLLVNDTTRR